jgi:uncharacterized protein YdeI (YjbR/CyaY-like superfamily)
MDDREHVHVETRDEVRAWLERNHASSPGAWIVTWKAATGRPRVTAAEIGEEALCFGWVDSRPGTVDADRSRLYISPRSPKSAWSAVNKARVERLTAAGRMHPAGAKAIATAKANGAWSALDAVEAGVIPRDLAAAFRRHARSKAAFEGFPRSARRAILEWIEAARTEPTRAKRVEETARLAAEGIRANQWRGPREPS